MPKLTEEELRNFFEHEFPQMNFILEKCDSEYVTIRKEVYQQNLRPGGTVSGPTMMALADFAIYAAILREIGLVKLAVTTSFNINFLKKPLASKDILAECKLRRESMSQLLMPLAPTQFPPPKNLSKVTSKAKSPERALAVS